MNFKLLDVACPSQKWAFNDCDAAERAARNIRKMRHRQNPRMAPYRCSLCGCWHLTSQLNRNPRAGLTLDLNARRRAHGEAK